MLAVGLSFWAEVGQMCFSMLKLVGSVSRSLPKASGPNPPTADAN